MFSNAGVISTAKDIFAGNFLELLEEVISGATVLWADWLHLTSSELANIFSLNFSIIRFSCLKSFTTHLSYVRNSYNDFQISNIMIMKFY